MNHTAAVFEATAELSGDRHVPLKYNMMGSPSASNLSYGVQDHRKKRNKFCMGQRIKERTHANIFKCSVTYFSAHFDMSHFGKHWSKTEVRIPEYTIRPGKIRSG